MTKDKMIKLVEALAPAGYEIIELKTFSESFPRLSLRPVKKNSSSKERIIRLIEFFFAIGYRISEYKVSRKLFCGVKFEIDLYELK